MNKLSLKKLKEGLIAEYSEPAPLWKDNIQLYDFTSVAHFNELSILRDWPDENDGDLSGFCIITFCSHCGNSN